MVRVKGGLGVVGDLMKGFRVVGVRAKGFTGSRGQGLKGI